MFRHVIYTRITCAVQLEFNMRFMMGVMPLPLFLHRLPEHFFFNFYENADFPDAVRIDYSKILQWT